MFLEKFSKLISVCRELRLKWKEYLARQIPLWKIWAQIIGWTRQLRWIRLQTRVTRGCLRTTLPIWGTKLLQFCSNYSKNQTLATFVLLLTSKRIRRTQIMLLLRYKVKSSNCLQIWISQSVWSQEKILVELWVPPAFKRLWLTELKWELTSDLTPFQPNSALAQPKKEYFNSPQ